MRQPEKDMIEQIFSATEQLMAQGGLHSLSMHKIAKYAGISAGTIYIYFKNKEELLEKFAQHLFFKFENTLWQHIDESCSYFEQYRQMWWNVWSFLKDNPTITVNLNQYQALPSFCDMCKEWENESYWINFCQKAVKDDVLCDLSGHILFLLSIGSAIKLSVDCYFLHKELSNDVLESVIEHTWRSIQK